MARLMTNTVLIRFELPSSPLKFEGENKTNYLAALCQIDLHGDYEALKYIISCGVIMAPFNPLTAEQLARLDEAPAQEKRE